MATAIIEVNIYGVTASRIEVLAGYTYPVCVGDPLIYFPGGFPETKSVSSVKEAIDYLESLGHHDVEIHDALTHSGIYRPRRYHGAGGAGAGIDLELVRSFS